MTPEEATRGTRVADRSGNEGEITASAWYTYDGWGYVCTVLWDDVTVSTRIDGTDTIRVELLRKIN